MRTETRTTRVSLYTRLFSMMLVVASCAALFACGGSGSGSADTSAPVAAPVGSIAVGSFVCPPVAGLAYESASQSGITDVNGNFSYRVGSPVTFKVGDIVVGSTTGSGVLTPISLAGSGSSADSPKAVAIVQFLNAIANDDGAGNLSIPESIRTAALGKSIDFDAADAATQVANVVEQLAPGTTLVSAKVAASYTVNRLYRLAAGTYSGRWIAPASVPSSGSFTVTIKSDGTMRGIAMLGSTKVDVTSTMTSKLLDDSIYAITGTVSNGATWKGKIDLEKKKLSGTALYDGVNATFSAER